MTANTVAKNWGALHVWANGDRCSYPEPTSGTATVEYAVASESNAGMDGSIQWQSVFLLADDRIASWGTGNHDPEQSNAVRIIDPVTTPGSVTAYDEFPWTQSAGANLYVSNFDNHPSIYIPSDNVGLWIGHGVFDFDTSVWTYGDRSPLTDTYDDFVDVSALTNFFNCYNPAVAWSTTLDKGAWFGNATGGTGNTRDTLVLLERQAVGLPWKLTPTDMGSQGVGEIDKGRNSAVCIGDQFYLEAPLLAGGNAFYKIDLSTQTLTATLTAPTRDVNDYYPQLVHDSARSKLILIGIKLLEYDIAGDTWSDITPAGWPGYKSAMGVYHATLGVIFFRGLPQDAVYPGSDPKNFEWHKITVV